MRDEQNVDHMFRKFALILFSLKLIVTSWIVKQYRLFHMGGKKRRLIIESDYES